MNFFWTAEADRQYLKHFSDSNAHHCFDDLLKFIEDDPSRGVEIRLIELSEDPWETRAFRALRDTGLIGNARIVLANVYRPAITPTPPVLGAVVHTPNVPPHVKADHTILTLGLILRTNKFD